MKTIVDDEAQKTLMSVIDVGMKRGAYSVNDVIPIANLLQSVEMIESKPEQDDLKPNP